MARYATSARMNGIRRHQATKRQATRRQATGRPLSPRSQRRLLKSIATCAMLPANIEVFNASESTQCRQVDAAGVGNADVIAAGFRDAVDIWGWVPGDLRVCFRVAGGSFKFLDAATAPRAVSDLPAQSYHGHDLRDHQSPGHGRPAALVRPRLCPQPAPTAIGSKSLSGCMVRANVCMLNLRDAPAGEVIGEVAYNATLTALSRTVGWFEVDNNGVTGWIAAMYVSPDGNCG